MVRPLVSVIMPAFNAEKFIAESIRSVINQTYAEWELIVVDDGSVDSTALIVKNLMNTDSRIKYIYQANGKQGKARNNGLRNSRGEFIAFLDADDLWLSEKLDKQVYSFAETNADLIFSGTHTFEILPEFTSGQNQYAGYYSGDSALKTFLVSNYIPVLTVMVKKKAVERVGGFSENPAIQNAEDYHLWLKLLATGNVFWGSTEVLAFYRIHATSVTAADRQVIFPMLASLKELAGEHPEKEMLIKECFLKRINNHLSQNNIADWGVISRLINLRAAITQKKTLVYFWKPSYLIFGKRIFRQLYIVGLKLKRMPAAGNVNINSLHV